LLLCLVAEKEPTFETLDGLNKKEKIERNGQVWFVSSDIFV
jgi:hypothetical protein